MASRPPPLGQIGFQCIDWTPPLNVQKVKKSIGVWPTFFGDPKSMPHPPTFFRIKVPISMDIRPKNLKKGWKSWLFACFARSLPGIQKGVKIGRVFWYPMLIVFTPPFFSWVFCWLSIFGPKIEQFYKFKLRGGPSKDWSFFDIYFMPVWESFFKTAKRVGLVSPFFWTLF